MRRLTKEEFIEKAKVIHGDKYDYSKVEYTKNNVPVTIICPIHGEFWQIPNAHLRGQGCRYCGLKKKADKRRTKLEDFVKQAIKIHGNKYDYSKVNYKNNRTEITIICPIHGEFQQTPGSHLRGCGCTECAGRHKWTTESIVIEFKKVHGNKYDYSKVNYNGIDNYVTIICPIHGEFQQTPYHHLQGNGCRYCKSSRLERIIDLMLTEYNIEYERNTKKILGRLELDFYIPSKKIGIECQGIQHFKPSRLFGKNEHERTLKRDDLKRQLCKEKGIKLLYYSDLGIEYPYFVYEDKEELLKAIMS